MNKQPKTMEIWLAKFPLFPSHAVRPVVVISDCQEGDYAVSVVPLSTKLEYPQKVTHVLIPVSGNLSRTLCEYVTTIPVSFLRSQVGYVEGDFERMAIRHAIAKHFALCP